MLQFEIIGNLGADAQVKTENGRQFVSFNVAHTDSWQSADGQQHKSTQWVSCAMNGDGGSLLQYLRKGKTVYVQGRGSSRIYSSPKEHRMVAGLNISVDRIELLSGSDDVVPRRLVSSDGELIDVNKAYYIDINKAKAMGASKKNSVLLCSQSGQQFSVDGNGFVWPTADNTPAESQESAAQ